MHPNATVNCLWSFVSDDVAVSTLLIGEDVRSGGIVSTARGTMVAFKG